MKEKKTKRGTEKIITFRPRIKKTTECIKTGIKVLRIGFNPDEPNYFTIA